MGNVLTEGTAQGNSQNQINPGSHSFKGISSQYRLRVPEVKTETNTRPLLVFFHGNLGSNFGPASIAPSRILASTDRPTGTGLGQPQATLDQILAESNESKFWDNFVLLAILVPTDSPRKFKDGFVITWGSMVSPLSKIPAEQIDFNADFAQDLIQIVIAKYSVDPRQVYLAGQSGGSLFLTNTMIPKYGKSYQGGAILMCGGEVPRETFAGNLDADFAKNFHLHFHSTTNESEHIKPLLDQAQAAYKNIWRDAAIQPDLEIDGDGKHCLFKSGTQPSIIKRQILKWQSSSNSINGAATQ